MISKVKCLFLVVILVLTKPHVVNAQRLPSIQEKPWLGFFSGYEQRYFQFGISNNGQCELYLMKNRKQRASSKKTVKIYAEVHAKNRNTGRVYVRKLKKDEGFVTKLKPGIDHEEAVFTAEATSGSKVQIKVKYDGNRIILDGKILDAGDEFKNPEDVYFIFKVKMPSFYNASTYSKDPDKAKGRMRRDDFRIVRAKDGKRLSLKVYEKYNFDSEELAHDGITMLEANLDAQEGRRFVFSTLGGKGTLQLENSRKGTASEPWRGYFVNWIRPFQEKKGKEKKPLVIEVK